MVIIIKRVVFYDYGGSHSSVVAAFLQVGKLNPEQIPSGKELMDLPYLDKTTPHDFGKLRHVGTDKNKNEVYVLGMKNSSAGSLLQSLVDIQRSGDQFIFLGTMPYVNNILRIGGWLSRAASLPSIGRPLVIKGLQKSYAQLCLFVQEAGRQKEGEC